LPKTAAFSPPLLLSSPCIGLRRAFLSPCHPSPNVRSPRKEARFCPIENPAFPSRMRRSMERRTSSVKSGIVRNPVHPWISILSSMHTFSLLHPLCPPPMLMILGSYLLTYLRLVLFHFPSESILTPVTSIDSFLSWENFVLFFFSAFESSSPVS